MLPAGCLPVAAELIQREVNNGIAKAMAEDVPQRINQVHVRLACVSSRHSPRRVPSLGPM